jgi:hypothetical protein
MNRTSGKGNESHQRKGQQLAALNALGLFRGRIGISSPMQWAKRLHELFHNFCGEQVHGKNCDFAPPKIDQERTG